MKRGVLITLYGINNIGKTTQARMLLQRLRHEKLRVRYIKFPIYTLRPSGPYLNRLLRASRTGTRQRVAASERELQLWFAVNRYQFAGRLEKMLAAGYIVIAEDYVGTGIAWGATKGADRVWLETINAHLQREDLPILLQGERIMRAKEAGHLHESDDALVERARRTFSMLGRRYGWTTVRLSSSRFDSAERIYTVVKKFLSTR